MHNVDNLLLQLGINQALTIFIAIISAFTAKVRRQCQANLRTDLPLLHILIDGSNPLGHCHLFHLLIGITSTIMIVVGEDARPSLIPLGGMNTHLMTKASLRHLTITLGAQGPPKRNFFIVEHTCKGTKKYGDLQVFCVFFTINMFAYTNGFVAYTRLSPVNQLFAF